MKPDGFADRLDVDEDGNVVTIYKDQDGNESVTYDGDVMPILDAFVKEHPEFSYRGAKGIVALTGYAGAFGYRITDPEDYTDEEFSSMCAKVSEIAAALRASGWEIASHSYTHNSYWSSGAITMSQMKSDIDRWKTLIEPYVGETHIFISPYGAHFAADDERFRYIVDSGFYIYCPVGTQMATVFNSDNMVQDRFNMDGYNLLIHPERVNGEFFDPSLVVDPTRPALD